MAQRMISTLISGLPDGEHWAIVDGTQRRIVIGRKDGDKDFMSAVFKGTHIMAEVKTGRVTFVWYDDLEHSEQYVDELCAFFNHPKLVVGN